MYAQVPASWSSAGNTSKMASNHISNEEGQNNPLNQLHNYLLGYQGIHTGWFSAHQCCSLGSQSRNSDVHFTTSSQWRDTSSFRKTMHKLTWNIWSGANQDMAVKFSPFWTCSFKTLEDHEEPAIQEQCVNPASCAYMVVVRTNGIYHSNMFSSYSSGRNGWTVGGTLWKSDGTSPTNPHIHQTQLLHI